MDEQDRLDIGDGSDNAAQGARSIESAMQTLAQGRNGGGNASNSGEQASEDSGKGSGEPDNQGGDPGQETTGSTGSDAPDSGVPDAVSNDPAPSDAPASAPPPNAAQGADASQAAQNGGGGNLVSQKGLETGANQAAAGAGAAQAGGAAGANAAAKGAEATANAAAASAQASMQAGNAASGIAAGTAAGGPWGALIMAAWSLRHTLFKILVCICLSLAFLIAMVVSLPSIVFNYVFRTDPASVGVAASYNIHDIFDDVAAAVSACVTAGYDHAFAEVERIIAAGGFDYEHSMQALINHGATSAEYDVSYVVSAYSVSMEQRGTSKQDMINKLMAVSPGMFPVTYEVKETTVMAPAGDDDSEPLEETISYVECTIHPFDQSVILRAYQIDPTARYSQFLITNGEAIMNMTNAVKMTMFGSFASGAVPPISDAELAFFVASLDCSQERKELITAALSLVGRVPYFWGGKSAAGWNSEWNTPKLVTAAGSSSTGTIRPFGLDCSGFTDWVYRTALGASLHEGGWSQWDSTSGISKDELLPGDLGFLAQPGTVPVNHVLIFAGKDSSGNLLWVHCSSGSGVILNSPGYVSFFRRPTVVEWSDGNG